MFDGSLFGIENLSAIEHAHIFNIVELFFFPFKITKSKYYLIIQPSNTTKYGRQQEFFRFWQIDLNFFQEFRAITQNYIKITRSKQQEIPSKDCKLLTKANNLMVLQLGLFRSLGVINRLISLSFIHQFQINSHLRKEKLNELSRSLQNGLSIDRLKLRPQKEAFYYQEKVGPHFNSGKWTFRECMKYVQFLKNNITKLDSESRKKFNIFHRMAAFIKSRASAQCTSRHQKLMQKYGSISRIIEGESVRLTEQSRLIQEKPSSINEKMAKSYESSQKSDENSLQSSPANKQEEFPQAILLETKKNTMLRYNLPIHFPVEISGGMGQLSAGLKRESRRPYRMNF